MVLIVMMLFTLATAAGGNDYWTQQCPTSCRCLWSGGKKVAECNEVGLTAIPDTLSDEVQVLYLNENKIHSLYKDAFRQVKLVNLHKLFLKKSHITSVDKEALSGMKVLIELDLSHNKIATLHNNLFRECEKIREIFLSYNPIQKIDAGLFTNLPFLQKVELNHCQIKQIEVGSIVNVPLFSTLDLRGNQLSFLDLNVVRDIGKLHSLSLMDNPWDCNCHLRKLRTWVFERKLYTDPIMCNLSKSWKDMTDSEFACAPEILSVGQEGWTLSCHVNGDPRPMVEWFFNGKPVNNHSYTGAEYLFRRADKWFNLTVRHARSRDNGEYKCRATNEGGVQEGLLDVTFLNNDDDDSGGFGVPGAVIEVWPLIVGVVLGAVVLLAVVLVVCCCFCKNHRRVAGKKEANGTVGGLEAEEKTLMHSVNPVQKPPRRQETALNTSETELLDAVSLPFNENGSILGSTIHESQLDTSVGRAPDLITIPGKTMAVSPTTKPLGSQFGTLPYARSHSPFSPPAPVVPRSGYVTIPRRPRVPSWTASLSPVVSPDDAVAVVEPVYDNLGPRTTADGSSVLSLNNMDMGLPAAYKNRPLPLAPTHNSSVNEHRRQSWSRGTPDISDERQLLIATSPQPSIAPAKKIPPNPPPKPKKKVGKTFDDEGEDGTEV